MDTSSSMCDLPIQMISNKKEYMEKHHKKHEVKRNLEVSILEFLEALLMCIYHIEKETSLMIKVKNTSLIKQ